MIVNTVIPLSLLALLIGVVLGTGLFMLRGYNGDRHARTLRNIARLEIDLGMRPDPMGDMAARWTAGVRGGAPTAAQAARRREQTLPRRSAEAINAEAVRVARLHYRAEERASAIAETLRLLKGV